MNRLISFVWIFPALLNCTEASSGFDRGTGASQKTQPVTTTQSSNEQCFADLLGIEAEITQVANDSVAAFNW